MSHRLFEERLGPWLDGELTEDASREVADHVRQCDACRSRVEETRRLSSAIRRMDRHSMPVDLKAKLMTGAQSHRGSGVDRFHPAANHWVLGSAAAAAGVVFLVLALRPGTEMVKPVVGGPVEIAVNPRETSAGDKAANPAAPTGDISKDAPAPRSEPLSTPAPPPRKVRSPGPAPARDTNSARRSDSAPAAAGERAADELKSLALPAAPIQRNIAAKQAPSSPVARFETQLILKGTQPPVLGPIVPAVSDTASGPVETPLAKEKAVNSSAGTASSTISLLSQETVQTRMTFLVRLDQNGRVLSVDSVGALVVSPERARMVHDLLAASTLPPRAPGDPTLVVVEVLITGE